MKRAAFSFISWHLLIAVSLFFSSVQCFSLTLLHTNDNHGRFEETDAKGFKCFPKDAQANKCFGGVARRATMLKRIRSQEKNVLLVSGGDVFTGTLWYEVYRGNATIKFMNQLGYDAVALGNHEFDDGVENLVSFLKAVNFSVVVANLNVSQEPRWPKSPQLFTRYKVFNVSGEKIGVVGYVLESTLELAKPGPGPNVHFLPEVESVRSAVDELKKQNINKIIAVGHAGIETDKKVAEVDGVDIVVGGHSNTFLYTGTPPSTEKPYGPYPLVIQQKDNPDSKALVVQAFAYGKYLGRLNVDFDNTGKVTAWSGNPILLNSSVPQDQAIEQQVQQMKIAVDKVSDVKVGESYVFLNNSKPECLLKECNLGNLVTDAFVLHYSNQSASDKQWTEASIAIQNSGSITASIDVSVDDPITYGHIVNCFPYRNTVDLVELKGMDLLEVFEQVASKYDPNDPSNSFLQVSGILIKYDMTKPSGQRVKDLQIRCAACMVPKYEPLNRTAVYKLILPSYLAKGGAGLSVIKEKQLSHRASEDVDRNVIENYLKAKSPLTLGVENRITFAEEETPVCVAGGSVKSWNMLYSFAMVVSVYIATSII